MRTFQPAHFLSVLHYALLCSTIYFLYYYSNVKLLLIIFPHGIFCSSYPPRRIFNLKRKKASSLYRQKCVAKYNQHFLQQLIVQSPRTWPYQVLVMYYYQNGDRSAYTPRLRIKSPMFVYTTRFYIAKRRTKKPTCL